MGTEHTASISISQPDALTASAEVSAPPAPTILTTSWVKVSGGTAPYAYQCTNGEISSSERLAPGAHTVTVTDSRVAQAPPASKLRRIYFLSVVLREVAAVNCYGDQNAALQVEVKAAKRTFRYQWSAPHQWRKRSWFAGKWRVRRNGRRCYRRHPIRYQHLPTGSPVCKHRGERAFSDTSNDGKAHCWVLREAVAAIPTNGIMAKPVPTTENLGLGKHSVTVTDSKGCTASTTFEITERIMKELPPAPYAADRRYRCRSCNSEADSTNITDDNRYHPGRDLRIPEGQSIHRGGDRRAYQ